MRASEYERLKKQITDEYREKLNALELVWTMSNLHQAGPAVAHTPTQNGANNAKTGLARAMRGAITAFKERPFTLTDVEQVIRIKNPQFGPIRRQSMATAIGRMERKGIVIEVSPGKGKTEAVFQLPDAVAPAPVGDADVPY